jgi:hypothetical protein
LEEREKNEEKKTITDDKLSINHHASHKEKEGKASLSITRWNNKFDHWETSHVPPKKPEHF